MPKIGITCDFESITDRRGRCTDRYILSAAYVQAVVAAGGQPWLIPHGAGCAKEIMRHVDGLVISGGNFDIPPAFYGATPNSLCGPLVEARSNYERELCQLALTSDLPLLGICGGMQLLCVVTGGSLYQDLSERPNTQVHEQPHETSQPFHKVQLTEGSLAARVFGTCAVEVNTTHHQVVRQLGSGLRATGLAPDGVIEAIEVADKTFALGLQWHPEALLIGTPAHPAHLGPYRGLVQAASLRRAGHPKRQGGGVPP